MLEGPANVYSGTGHPDEAAFERLLVNDCAAAEHEHLEMHILCCADCVQQLEQIEQHHAVMKLALMELEWDHKRRSVAGRYPLLRHFLVGQGRWGLGVASLIVAAVLARKSEDRTKELVSDVQLTALRGGGGESGVGLRQRRLRLSLQLLDLHPVGVTVEIVDANGLRIWAGPGQVQNDAVVALASPIGRPGQYFVRLYVGDRMDPNRLIREFSFNVE